MDVREKFKAYKITCIPTGKVYIGITSGKIKSRWSSHMWSANSGNLETKLYRTIRKYGSENFKIEHIATSFSFSDLLAAEIFLIRQYNSKKRGMNSTLGGDGVTGVKWSISDRIKMSEKRKLIWKNPEYRNKFSISQKIAWKNKSPEEIEKHRERARKMAVSKNRKPRSRRPKPERWKGKGWNMKIKTHCPQGHEYTPENTYSNPRKKNTRECLACKRLRRNSSRDRKRKISVN